MNTLLVTGVGAVIGYGAARSARAARYPVRVVGMDIYGNAAGRHWCDRFERAVPAASPEYPEFVRDLVQRHAVDLVLPCIEQDVARMSAERASFADLPAQFVLNPPELLEVAADKWLTHLRLVEAGLPVIPTRLGGSFDELSAELGTPFLLKPRRSYASKGIRTIHDARDLHYWRPEAGDTFMAQRIVGNPDSEYSVGLFGYGEGSYSHAITLRRRLSSEGSTAQAWVESPPGLERRIAELVALFRPLGPTNLQFRRHEGEFLLLEVNPRLSSSNSLRTAFGINEVELCLEYYLQGRRPSPRAIQPGCAVRFLEDLVTYDGDPV
ncbi:MAG: ATP-grasp domain-containing protein [Isosphaeraceae bacterium]|nr:ATP-grasp domain-containing protein [Isosphaeraceae bacterium]